MSVIYAPPNMIVSFLRRPLKRPHKRVAPKPLAGPLLITVSYLVALGLPINKTTRAGCSALVDLLLLVDAELPGAAVDQEKQTAHDREDLEEVVLGEVLVRVVLVKL
jgi:hypothetical protein